MVTGLDKVSVGPKVVRELAVDVKVAEGFLIGYVVLVFAAAGLLC